MLGLERVLGEKPPRLASGTELRRHQVDALAGMLTELIAANQKAGDNGSGVALVEEVEEDEDEDDDLQVAEAGEEDEAARAAVAVVLVLLARLGYLQVVVL